MTPSPSATSTTSPPTISQRREIARGRRMRSRYNNEPRRTVLLTRQGEDVPVILDVVAPGGPVTDRHRLLRVEHALLVGAVDRDRELELLLAAIAQQDRRGALREPE